MYNLVFTSYKKKSLHSERNIIISIVVITIHYCTSIMLHCVYTNVPHILNVKDLSNVFHVLPFNTQLKSVYRQSHYSIWMDRILYQFSIIKISFRSIRWLWPVLESILVVDQLIIITSTITTATKRNLLQSIFEAGIFPWNHTKNWIIEFNQKKKQQGIR